MAPFLVVKCHNLLSILLQKYTCHLKTCFVNTKPKPLKTSQNLGYKLTNTKKTKNFLERSASFTLFLSLVKNCNCLYPLTLLVCLQSKGMTQTTKFMQSVQSCHEPAARHTWMLVCLDNVLVTE